MQSIFSSKFVLNVPAMFLEYFIGNCLIEAVFEKNEKK